MSDINHLLGWITEGCFAAGCLILVGALILVLFRIQNRGKEHRFSTAHCVFAFFFLAAVVLHYPMYFSQLSGEPGAFLESMLLSVHHSIRLFVLDEETSAIREFAAEYTRLIPRYYIFVTVLVYLSAPVLTLSIVLSFFQNFSLRWKLFWKGRAQTYVFTESCDTALELAESIRQNHPRSTIVFTGITDATNEQFPGARERLSHLRAICFPHGPDELPLKPGREHKLIFFAISKNENTNLLQATALKKKYAADSNTTLYIFAQGVESEMLFRNAENCKMSIRRIDMDRAFVYWTLYQDGARIFENAVPGPDGNRDISAVIIGLGGTGTQMLKALTWCCQMDGYSFRALAMDEAPNALARMRAICPELMDEAHNGVTIDGEAQYTIQIQPGMDFAGDDLEMALSRLNAVTYVFIDHGDDSRNIRTAIRIREICARAGYHPIIQAMVRDSEKMHLLSGVTNYKGTPYDISFIGSRETYCSETVLLHSELEELALQRHLRWGSEESFWMYEFNYNSSVASVIHLKLRQACGIPGTDIPVEQRSPEQRTALEKLEHRRWNAYIRSEGYRFSGSTDPRTRNDLAKLHNSLVPFSRLTESEKKKDDV